MKVGIVGLPNVGKSTLFNALTKSKLAEAANYPFCTIEPNVGIVEVPDFRLKELARVSGAAKIIPAIIEFVDIAGLVKGASKGEGLGNQFLTHIREVDAIVEVVRLFNDNDVIHVAGRVNPEEDAEIINIELALADLSVVKKGIERAQKENKSQNSKDSDKVGGSKWKVSLFEKVTAALETGKRPDTLDLSEDEKFYLKELNLLTSKPLMYLLNTDEYNKDSIKNDPKTFLSAKCVSICAKLEAELADLGDDEAKEYLKSLGVEESGLDRFIRTAYETLGLITFFTSGEKETRAWTITRGAKGPEAAGVIHSDFEKAFIRAEVIDYKDFISLNGEAGARDNGKLRVEGKEYVMQDGDVCHFRVGV